METVFDRVLLNISPELRESLLPFCRFIDSLPSSQEKDAAVLRSGEAVYWAHRALIRKEKA